MDICFVVKICLDLWNLNDSHLLKIHIFTVIYKI